MVLLASSEAAEVTLGAQVAGAFKLAAAEPALSAVLARASSGVTTPVTVAVLRALRENAAGPGAVFERLIREAKENTIRDAALAALAASHAPDAPARLVQLLPALAVAQRGPALDRIAGNPAGAAAIVGGLRAGMVTKADIGAGTAEKLRLLLPDDGAVATLWQELGGDAARALRLPGGPGNFADTQLALAGPFTIECWAKLDPGIDQRDGLLGAAGQFDLNFHEGRFRVWLPDANDVVIAMKRTVAGVWTHYAITRDAGGFFRLFLNGELEGTSAGVSQTAFSGLNVGRSRQNANAATTAGWLAEYRVWSVARSPQEIRDHFDRSLAGTVPAARPAGLTHIFSGASWGPLSGSARVEVVDDGPVLLTAAQAAVQEKKFAHFRALANRGGSAAAGGRIFASLCLTCHQHAGQGGQIAPPLDGIGNTGVEALLRHILTPSAAMESAYRTFRVVGTDGSVRDGFLVEETAESVVLRTPGAEDRRIPRAEIKKSSYLNRSLMPEGLLETMTPEQVADLFAHLKSLR